MRTIFFLLSWISFFCSSALSAEQKINPRYWTYEVIQKIDHPHQPFTEGLQVIGNDVFESSGLYGGSYLSRWSLEEKKPAIKKILSNNLFAEGLTILNNQGYLLTWQAQRGFVFDIATLRITRQFSYQGEGWGLTNDGKSLIMSNGSAELRWLSPKDFSVEKTLTVTRNQVPLKKINELEWVNGKIFANIWESNDVVVIDPIDGHVIATIDFSALSKAEANTPPVDVLNGIAYDRRNNTLLITGKYWKKVYRIKIIEQ
jgi:glutamine cyclotransferase